jgi:hypothetical protein
LGISKGKQKRKKYDLVNNYYLHFLSTMQHTNKI